MAPRTAKKSAENTGFDDEVDAARGKLEAALRERDSPFDDIAALNALLPKLEEKRIGLHLRGGRGIRV
jgi:hypothetical protein